MTDNLENNEYTYLIYLYNNDPIAVRSFSLMRLYLYAQFQKTFSDKQIVDAITVYLNFKKSQHLLGTCLNDNF